MIMFMAVMPPAFFSDADSGFKDDDKSTIIPQILEELDLIDFEKAISLAETVDGKAMTGVSSDLRLKLALQSRPLHRA